MGWDVVEIGLGHNLPISDPYATAETIAKRMNKNVRLVFYDEYHYDAEKNVISDSKENAYVTLREFVVNDSKDFLCVIARVYQVQQLLQQLGMEKLREASLNYKYSDILFEEIESPYTWYEIVDTEEDFEIRIFNENVELDVPILARWAWWESCFHDIEANREVLYDYRMEFYKRAKLFGCQKVIICADQGPGQVIFGKIDLPAKELEDYARSYAYLDEEVFRRDFSADEWKMTAKHISFSDVFQNRLNLLADESVEVIYDDFSDLETM